MKPRKKAASKKSAPKKQLTQVRFPRAHRRWLGTDKHVNAYVATVCGKWIGEIAVSDGDRVVAIRIDVDDPRDALDKIDGLLEVIGKAREDYLVAREAYVADER